MSEQTKDGLPLDVANQAAEAQDLQLAVSALFDKGDNKPFIPSLGRSVTVSPAKMWQMGPLMNFFKEVIGRLPRNKVDMLITRVAEEQLRIIADGGDPTKLNLQAMVTSDAVIGEVMEHVSLVTSFMAETFDILPEFVAMFTDVTPAEFKELEFDEGALLAFGIFALNYDFFTQRLLPICTGFLRSLASENQSAIKAAAAMRKLELKSRK